MIYNSFVRRSLIERVRNQHGKYFFGSLPDVTSGIVNAAACEVFLRSTRPLSIWGVSRHSTGHNTWSRTDRTIVRTEFERDFPLLANEQGGFPSWNFELAIANEMELLREQVLGGDDRLAFDNKRLVQHVADAINHRPDQYEQTAAVVESMIHEFGIPRDEILIPPRVDRPAVVPVGVYRLGPSKVRSVIDGDELGLATVDDAARFAARLGPATDTAIWEDELAAVPLVSTKPLSFAAERDGERALVAGWSESEAWGTWGIGRESRIRFALAATNVARRLLALKYRVIASDGVEPLVVECAARGEILDRWSLGPKNHRGLLTIELPPPSTADGEIVELTFTTANPRSPAELGLGPDVRRLGIGVEELRVLS
jgi:hypothetical protein